MTDKMREAFEKWLDQGNHCGCNENMWKAWQSAQSAAVPVVWEPDCYDAGLLSDFGGGNVEWWRDYIRAELARAHEFYASQMPATSISAAELDALRKDAESNADRDIAVMRASIVSYKEARNGIERHPGNTAHENAAWEWGRKDGGWDGKH